MAQEKRIAVMEKSSRADKQKDVIDANYLSISIMTELRPKLRKLTGTALCDPPGSGD